MIIRLDGETLVEASSTLLQRLNLQIEAKIEALRLAQGTPQIEAIQKELDVLLENRQFTESTRRELQEQLTEKPPLWSLVNKV